MAGIPHMSYEDAKEHLRSQEAVMSDGSLYNLGMYLAWSPGKETATLDGVFTAKDLWAIATYMREHEEG